VRVGAPSGTVTFLFTDIEGSTRLWQQDEAAMRAALERHDSILRSAIDGHGGYAFSTGGDGFGVAFARAGEAVAAAVDAQMRLAAEPWPEGAPIRVRMGLHTGEVSERDGDYFGTPVTRRPA
jgi:class 3 adenylate cyclase